MAFQSIPFNPAATTNAAGLFVATAHGSYPGVYVEDPATRYSLAGGVLATAETLPMWGGVGISEKIPTSGYSQLGSTISRATAQANLSGFSVFNQEGAWLSSPQSPVPLGLTGGQVNFFRFGSNARLWLPIDPALVSLDGGLTNQQVSWDYANQKIVAYDSTAALPIKILSVQTAGAYNVSYTANVGATWNSTSVATALVII